MTTVFDVALLPRSACDAALLKSNPKQQVFDCCDIAFVLIANPDMPARTLAKTLVTQGMTAGVLPASACKPQALFFDMDATVILEESLVEISKVAGKETEISALTQKAMEGGMDFGTSLRMRLQILKGLPRGVVLSVSPTYSPGIRETLKYCNTQQIPCFLVSGGFVDLAGPVAKDLGFKDFKANRFLWDGDKLAGDVEGELLDADGKLKTVQRWCHTHGFDPMRTIAVGDGANDLKMMNFCGASVGFMPKNALWPHVSLCNSVGDHRLLEGLLRLIPQFTA